MEDAAKTTLMILSI